MENNNSSNLNNGIVECCATSSRRVAGLGIITTILTPLFASGCATNSEPKDSRIPSVKSKLIVPLANSSGRDELLDAYNAFLGVQLAKFNDITLPAPDGFPITVRVASPAVAIGRLPIVVCSPDFADDAINYDILSGGLASRGYIVLSISSSGGANLRGEAATLRRSTRRAHQISYVLDNLPKVLGVLGRDAQMVDAAKIGVVGHAESAWTALGLVGWGPNLIPSSAIADGRITASFALSPSSIPVQQRPQTRSTARVIYGRTMIASDIDNMPPIPSGSGIIGINLPPVSPGFGGLLGMRQTNNRGRLQRPQREILASSCAGAGLFFDWSLKGEKSKLDILMACNGRVLGTMAQPFSIFRA